MATTLKKLSHAALVKMGPVRVDNHGLSEDAKIARLTIAGEEWEYAPPNRSCARAFEGDAKGKTFTIVAEGKGVEATVQYVGEPGTSVPPPNPQPREVVEKLVNKLAGEGWRVRPPGVLEAAKFVARQLSLMKICLVATQQLAEEVAAAGGKVSPEQFQAICSSLYIDARKGGVADRLPYSLRFPDLTVEAPAPKPGAAGQPGTGDLKAPGPASEEEPAF